MNSNTTAPNSSGQPQGNYTVTETDPAGDTITHYFSGEYETERQIKDVNLGVLSTTVTCYNGHNSSESACVAPSSVPALPIAQTDVYTYPGNTSTSPALAETTFDTYGNVTAVNRYDFGAAFPPSGTPLASTIISYNTGSSCGTLSNTYMHDRPCTLTTNSSGVQVSQTKYTYNGAGHPTQTQKWVSGSTYLTSSATFNANGTIATSTDANTAVTTLHYDGSCNSLLPTSTTFPAVGGVALTTSQTWDTNCVGAVITSATDANGNLTHYYYNDPLWRRTEIQNPDGGSTSIAYQTGSTTPWTIATTTAVSSSQSETTTATLDGLGRTVQSASTDPNSSNNNLSYVNTVYDSLGRLYSVTNPYFNPSDPTYGLTIYSYDALGRTLQVTNPDSTHRTLTYSGRAAELTDESSIQKAYQWDGLGRLAYVCDGIGAGKQANNATISSCGLDISSASGFKTTYGYDALGNLTSANVSGQSRSFVYDGLSRMTSETYPESGMATRAYDSGSAGDLYSVTKSAPNQTTFCTSTSPPGSCVTTYYQWDALHRLAAISFSDGSLGYNYTYDRTVNWGITLANTKGRLVEQEQGSGPTADASSTYSYDPMGRITDSWSCQADNCGATPKHLGYTFNYLGEIVTTLAANSAYTLTRAYNTIGELTGVTSSVSDTTHPPTLYSGATYNALGELIQATYGDGIVRTNTYDKRGRLLQRRDNPAYYALYLGYTPNGSVNYYNDSTAGDWSFTYDAFNRLASSTDASNGAAYSYSYDQYGNRWMQHLTAGTGNEVDYNFNTTYNQMTGGFVYDAAGNLASDPTCSPACGYWYDDLGQIKSAQGATFTYDGLGQRTEKSLSGTIRDLVYGLDGTPVDEFQGTTPTRHTEGFFTYANGETYFNRTDHLGTVRVRTDYTGAIIWSDGNLPFGDGETNGPYVDFTGFANGFWDSESNADHFGAREYAKTQGRWLSPDPAGLAAVDIANPQTWNRYAYVTNNPVSYVDPLGLFRQVPGACQGGQGICPDEGGGVNPAAISGGGFDLSGTPIFGTYWDDGWHTFISGLIYFGVATLPNDYLTGWITGRTPPNTQYTLVRTFDCFSPGDGVRTSVYSLQGPNASDGVITEHQSNPTMTYDNSGQSSGSGGVFEDSIGPSGTYGQESSTRYFTASISGQNLGVIPVAYGNGSTYAYEGIWFSGDPQNPSNTQVFVNGAQAETMLGQGSCNK